MWVCKVFHVRMPRRLVPCRARMHGLCPHLGQHLLALKLVLHACMSFSRTLPAKLKSLIWRRWYIFSQLELSTSPSLGSQRCFGFVGYVLSAIIHPSQRSRRDKVGNERKLDTFNPQADAIAAMRDQHIFTAPLPYHIDVRTLMASCVLFYLSGTPPLT